MYRFFGVSEDEYSGSEVTKDVSTTGDVHVKTFVALYAENRSSVVYIRWTGNEEQIILLQEFLRNHCPYVKPININKKFIESQFENETDYLFKIDVLFNWNDIYSNFKERQKGVYLCDILLFGDIVEYIKFNK